MAYVKIFSLKLRKLSPYIVHECITSTFYFSRERPKFQIDGEDENGATPLGEASGTVKVNRESGHGDTVRVRSVKFVDTLWILANCYKMLG